MNIYEGQKLKVIKTCTTLTKGDVYQVKAGRNANGEIIYLYTNLQPLWAKENLSKGAKTE